MEYKLYLGNCLDVLRECPDDYIDLVVTSPPYDNLRTYNGYTFDFKPIADQLARVLKPGGVIVWVVNDATVKGSETGSSFRQALYFMSIGLRLHDTMVWFKSNAIPLTHNRYDPAFEFMFVFSKGKPKAWNGLKERTKNPGTVKKRYQESKSALDFMSAGRQRNEETKVKELKLRKNVWNIPVGCDASNTTNHTAIFPLQLALDHIQSWSNPGDIVLDPFLGSGTTGVAALQLGRKFRGIEISEEYYQLAERRIEESLSGTEIQLPQKAHLVSE